MADSGPLTQAEGLALLRRTTDESWLQDFMATPDGTAIINSKLAVAAHASEAVMQQVAACSISTAPTGRTGSCDLTITRPNLATTAVIPKGFTFVDARGVQMLVALDVPVAAGQTSILLPLRTVRQIDLVNNPQPAFDDMLAPGDSLADIIDPVSTAVLDSASVVILGPTGYTTYGSSTAIAGAEMDWLSMHGDERGCHRQAGEDGEAYRLRVRLIPEAATPKAVQGAVRGAQGRLPDVYMIEPYRDQSSDAARLALELVFADSFFGEDSFCDDALGVDLPGKLPFRTLEAPDLRQGRAYFRQSIAGQLTEPDGSGCYSDDAFTDDPLWGFPDQGLSFATTAALHAVNEEARVKRAGGVQFDTYIENSTRLDSVNELVALPAGALAFAQSAPAGKAWMLRDGLVTVSGMAPATDSFAVVLVLADATLVSTGWISPLDGVALHTYVLERLGYFSGQVASIVVSVKSSVSNTLRAVGTFWTTQMTL
jgi:hypothetical protein